MITPSSASAQWTLFDGDRRLYEGVQWDELEQVIRQLPEKASWPNAICDLVSPFGNVLSMGIAQMGTEENPTLASDLACVNYQSASENPLYLHVVGDKSLDYDSGGVVVFRYENGSWTEILRRNCIPVETMAQIVKHFMENSVLPRWIEWEEV